eukprot:Protomagalhaensia_sp_Gyna_25__5657@NODE_79_length_5521_cov_51_014958_g60_i0_p1_GENE_NODE_79_length_5521_cov_51_014958_g60_i0NODE_79_length_5521_cov_51_014958_g60_i0_p1_ORF_typecomplete_len828_score201_61Suf/PF05843_14/9_7e05Suf/PF05843_14/44Suf/PF05843_14/0_016Suf/PF05843_14/1_3e11Suf/PF05843_14/1_1e06TPR_15/PF13429_6/1_6TPR_15/PF13429_6/36TPR_15/PF13429_6/0_016TPR_15/PF13429_6/33TPR_15/PF13429_6/0_0012TPR_15/PF13429_6/1_1TPR_MalT/PF17874_1/8_8TPR_MalT/PF17874_1/9_7e02TPR_MalT/PF17874_1/25TPR_Ma
MEVALQSPEFRNFGHVQAIRENPPLAPRDLKSWLTILRLKQHDDETRLMLHLGAVFYIPQSFKLWEMLFNLIDHMLDGNHEDSQDNDERAAPTRTEAILLEAAEALYRRAVAHLPSIPALRVRFCEFLWKRRAKVTETRRQYDEALRTLPLTQHHLIWRSYLAFIFGAGELPLTKTVVLRRFVQLFPQYTELYVAHLRRIGRLDEAAVVLAELVRDDSFQSLLHPNKQAEWLDFCLFLSTHGNKISSVPSDEIIRSSLRKFPEDIASLWCCLAAYYGVIGNFDQCCFTYDEALSEIRATKDFKVVFESYARFLEAGITSLKERKGSAEEVRYRIQKLEQLLDSREDLLSSVRIRRNPHDVYEWINRVKLFCRNKRARIESEESEAQEGSLMKPTGESSDLGVFRINGASVKKEAIPDPRKVIQVFSEALNTVDPLGSTTGPTSLLWVEFSHFYELFDEVDEARKILLRACQAPHKNLDSLVVCWCERVELELRHGQYDSALRLVREALKKPTQPGKDEVERDLTDQDLRHIPDPMRLRLHRSPRLWALCADLEESFGTFQSMRAAYDQMFDLKVITVPQILCLGEMLEKRSLFEDAFRVYEKGVQLFRWPHLNDLWIVYLSKFVSRFGSRKLDRGRELFERVVADVPKDFAWRFYFIYAKFEEHFGLIRNALSILHRAISNVRDDQKIKFYRILIYTTAEYFGLAKTRPIFDEALKNVPDAAMKEVGLWYAQLEAALVEVDRARAIYEHVASFCDIQKDADFWAAWRLFELTKGDEETFREMLRKRRAVAAQFEEVNALKFDPQGLEEMVQAETEKALQPEETSTPF